MRYQKFKRNANRGFTLVEMVVALFIVSVMMAVAIPNLQVAGAHAARTGCEANQRMVRAALTEYYLDHHGYPTDSTTDAIVADLKQNGYLDSTPTCAAGGSYTITIASDGLTSTVSCSTHGELGQ